MSSSSSSSASKTLHLYVLVHGMWGSPDNVAEMQRILLDEHPDKTDQLRVLVTKTNKEEGTYDGIDWCGERVVEEIMDEVKRLEQDGSQVQRFSITGYSLGGLISRYVLGILHARKFFEKVQPVNFSTIATPHVGLMQYGPGWLSKFTTSLGPKMLSRTGEQFWCMDNWADSSSKSNQKQPLLLALSSPSLPFYQALMQFQHIRIYANAVNDRTVPFVTAFISEGGEDPFWAWQDGEDGAGNGIELEFEQDPKYPRVIKSWRFASVVPSTASSSESTLNSTSSSTLAESEESVYRRPDPVPKASPLVIPPFLKKYLPFPLNLVLYTSLPLLLPLILTLVATRIAAQSRSSKKRVKGLEKEAALLVSGGDLDQASTEGSESETKKVAPLLHLLAQLEHLEREAESKVEEIVSDGPPPGPILTSTPSVSSESTATSSSSKSSKSKSKSSCKSKRRVAKIIPTGPSYPATLTPVHHQIIANLSRPELKQKMQKFAGWFPEGVNSHAVIISRDRKVFPEWHALGEGLLRHWAAGAEI